MLNQKILHNENILTLEPENKKISEQKKTSERIQNLMGTNIPVRDLRGSVPSATSTPQIGNYVYKKSQLEAMNMSDLRTLISEEGGNPGNTQDKAKLLNKIYSMGNVKNKIDMGAGVRSHTMRGSGLGERLLHKYNILSGEIMAGNDNPKIIKELYNLIDVLKEKNLLKVV
jgi:hypothetical protein